MAQFDKKTGERLDPENRTPGLRLASTIPGHVPSPGRVVIDQDGNVSPLVTSEPKPATAELPPAQAGPPESTGHEHEDE